MSYLRKIGRKLGIVFFNIAWAIRSLFWRRDKKIILFGSWFGERFADTSRYLFQFLSEHKEEFGLKHISSITR